MGSPTLIYPNTASAGPSATSSYIRASQIPGVVLDCNLNTGLNINGGGAATDNGPAINAYLTANVMSTNCVIILLDGGSLISGIFGPAAGNWGIWGLGWGMSTAGLITGTGFYMKTGSNNDVIHNGPSNAGAPSDPGGAAPARGANLTFRDFIINGNRGNGTNGNSTSGDPRGLPPIGDQWFYAFNMMNMENVLIDNIRVYNNAAYNIRFSNCGHFAVRNSELNNFLPGATVVAQNSDGIHINGPANDFTISNCTFTTGDDAIALNAPEGYGGLITRGAIVNCLAYQAQTMMRIYTGSAAPTGGAAQAMIDGITITNYQGTANIVGFLFGLEQAHTLTVLDSITNVTFTNCKVTCPSFCWIQDNIGTLRFDSTDWIGGSIAQGMLLTSTSNLTITDLTVSNCRILRTAGGSAATALLDMLNGEFSLASPTVTLKRFNVNGFRIVDAAGATYGAIADLIITNNTSTLASVQLDSVDPTNITALIPSSNAAQIASLGGPAVLSSQWPVPASIMANLSAFVDSTSNVPRIKVGGVAKTYTLF